MYIRCTHAHIHVLVYTSPTKFTEIILQSYYISIKFQCTTNIFYSVLILCLTIDSNFDEIVIDGRIVKN